jgi:hypothetical protein
MCLKSGGSALLESKKGAKIIQVELSYGIRTIRLYGDATIEEQGKLSSCYEKNISQDTTCSKDFVIGCTEKVLGGLLWFFRIDSQTFAITASHGADRPLHRVVRRFVSMVVPNRRERHGLPPRRRTPRD